MLRLFLVATVLLSILLSGCTTSSPSKETSLNKNQYKNPVFKPVIADPSIILGKDGYYYVYGTEENWGDGLGPRYVPVIRSKDLVKWKYVGEAFEAVKKPNWKEGGIWAPDIRFINGKYYLYYAMSTWGDEDPGIGVATSDKVQGPFTDHGPIFRSKDVGVENSIDPTFYEDKGTKYLFWGSFHGIYGATLTADGLMINGKPFQIAGKAFEAPYLIKKNGYFYMFLSSGSCCEGENSTYHVVVARSKSVTGPYLDESGKNIMTSSGTVILKGSKNFAGPGHNAIISDKKGHDWIIYHAIEKKKPKLNSGATRRPLMLDRVIWKNGWPEIKNQEPSERETSVPNM